MVDEQAEKQFVNSKVRSKDGKLRKVYHGTDAEFTEFSSNKNLSGNIWGNAFYSSTIKSLASDYGNNVLAGYLNIENPYVEGKSDLGNAKEIKNKYFADMWNDDVNAGLRYIQNKLDNSPLDLLQYIAKHNNIEIKQVLQDLGYDGVMDGSEIVFFNSNQFKSADAITYDDDGNVIPLSKRFDENDNDIRFSLRDDIDTQIEKVLNNTYDKNNHIYMGDTPQMLIDILGLHKLPMLLTNNHAYSMTVSATKAKKDGRYKKSTSYHNLGKERMKQLPKKIKEPVMILKSNTDTNNLDVIVITDMLDDNNRPVIVAIKPYGKGNYYNVEVDTNLIKSGYGKDKFNNFINNAIKENRVLYVNKKSSQRLNTKGVQYPNNIKSIDYNNSLSQYKTLVNSYYTQNFKNSAAKNSLRDNEVLDREQIESIIKEQFGNYSRTNDFKNNVLGELSKNLMLLTL